jgi:Zn ribbon nucleic-acid-binding protein
LGHCDLSLVGEPVPDVNLAGVVCPNCNEDDVSWLSVEDDSNIAHCDYCGCDFGLDNQL